MAFRLASPPSLFLPQQCPFRGPRSPWGWPLDPASSSSLVLPPQCNSGGPRSPWGWPSAWPFVSASSYLSNVLLEALVLFEYGLQLGLLFQPLLTSAMSFWRPSFSLRIAFRLASSFSLFLPQQCPSGGPRSPWGWPWAWPLAQASSSHPRPLSPEGHGRDGPG